MAKKKTTTKKHPKAKEPKPKALEKQEVTISKAKGRPMLSWVGKKPLSNVIAFPAQRVETFSAAVPPDIFQPKSDKDWPSAFPQGGLLFHGDNKEVLAHLLANGFRGKVNLIYIDPPFDSGADYVRKVELRGAKGIARLDGESYSLGEQIQYTDIWKNDSYLQFVYERILPLKEMLSNNGTLWLHCDYHRSHYLKCMCDEVFNEVNFVDEIVWNRAAPRGNVQRGLSVAHDTLLCYAKSDTPKWHPPTLKYTEEYKARFTKLDADGRPYALDNMISPNPDRPNLDYIWKGVRKVWRVTKEKMQELENQGRIEYTSSGIARYKRYLDELEGQPLTTLWTDIFPVNSQADEREDYPTQKPEALLERIIRTTTDLDDIVVDSFLGSGTTAAVAQKLGRRWIGCDINKGAIQTTSKRLQAIIKEQAEELQRESQQGELIANENKPPKPAQLSFTVYRVNDYDLQIQHNEAVNLACEHIGIQRTKKDSFFDGEYGKKLAKIVPFGHPISPIDLEEVKRELKARPGEDRDIVVVGLGKELAIDAWLEEWNRLRKKGDVPNKIEVIELRTDPKYGKFFKHEPAKAKVKISRKNGNIHVLIEDFISPSIIERLNQQNGVLQPKIDDWRSMVDCVMIDTNYNGEVFNVVLSDVPEKKNDFVVGVYDLPAPESKTKVAVKIVDMLGEEVLEVREA